MVTGDPCGNLVHCFPIMTFFIKSNGFFFFNLFTCYFISIDETPRVGSSVVVVGHLGSSGDGSSNIITCGYTNSAPRWSCLNSGSEDSSLLRTSQILDLALYAGKTCKKYVLPVFKSCGILFVILLI